MGDEEIGGALFPLELFQKVLIPLMVVSGFLPEKMAANLMEDIENI